MSPAAGRRLMGRRPFPHDMGGHAAGPVVPDADGVPVFAEGWHARAMAITVLSGALGEWTLDESRHMRESLPPEDYTRYTYYEKWLGGLANLLVRHGLATREELASGTAEPTATHRKALRADGVRAAIGKGGPSARPLAAEPRFKPGDTVTTRTPEDTARVPDGHTRLPGYAAGKTGEVVAWHGGHVLPDSNAHGLGEAPEHLYSVRFPAAGLWGDGTGEGDAVVVDCWESYLE